MEFYMSKYISLEREESSVDPLGLDYMAQQMSNWVLPNITTRNSRLRYYPMVCYGIYIINKMLENKSHIKDSDINDNFLRYEKIWAYAILDYYVKQGSYFSNDVERGLLGKRGTSSAYGREVRNLNDYKFLERQLQLGALGSYKSSLVKCGFIKEDSLTLTQIGIELAESFIHAGSTRKKQVDEYFIKMMRDEKIYFEYSNLKLDKLGYYISLDYSWNCRKEYEDYLDSDEIKLLKKHLIEKNEVTRETVNLINKVKEMGEENIIENICELIADNHLQRHIIEDFKRIRAFEKLSKKLLWIFRSIQYSLTQNNKISDISDIEIELDYDELLEVIEELKDTEFCIRMQSEDINFGFQFIELLDFIESNDNHKDIIEKIIEYHNYVYRKRNVRPIVYCENSNIILSYNNEIYDVEKNVNSHYYKIPNICSILRDMYLFKV